jgi:acetyltransferase-like isoleucine patch superfamily enzyme
MTQLMHYLTLLVWKFLPFVRPKNFVIKGRFLFNRKTKILLQADSSILFNGDADFSGSIITLINSNMIGNSVICNNTILLLNCSKIIFQDHLNFKNSNLNVDNSIIEGANHFRVHHFNIALTESTFRAGSYFMCDGQADLAGKLILTKATFSCQENCRIQCLVNVNNGDLILGNNCFINAGTKVNCQMRIQIGNYVMISYDCILLDNNSHSLDFLARRGEIDAGFPNGTKPQIEHSKTAMAPIIIEDDVWIGVKSMVFKGVAIGERAVIAAGTIVTKDVAKDTVTYGNSNKSKPIIH